jgi:site-specific DNA recombinase
MKAAGYTRTSTPTQAKKGESLRTQRDAIEKYATDKGWDLTEIYEDAGISGAKSDRPELLRLLEDARQNRFESLIIHRLSRFGRNARDLLNNYHALKDLDIETHFIKENIDSSTPTGRLLFTIMAAIAEMEREIIEDQMAENKMIKWKEKRTFLGKTSFGYKWNKETKELEIIPEEAKIFKKIISLYLDEGLSLKDITIRLTREGILGNSGKPFRANTLSYMLKNPCYYGHYILNRHEYEGRKRTGGLKPEEEHITFPCPAIISKTLWDKIQKKTEFNKGKGKRISESTKQYWLRDILECDECNGRIRHRQDGRIRRDGTINRYYACYWAGASKKELAHSGKKKCELPYIQAENLEGEIWSELTARLSFGGWQIKGKRIRTPLEALADPDRYAKALEDLEQQIKRHKKELEKIRKGNERIADSLNDPDWDEHKGLLLRQLNKNKEEWHRITGLLDEAKEKIAKTQEARTNEQSLKSFLRNNLKGLATLRDEIFNLPPDDKKTLIEAMLDEKIRIGKALKGDEPSWDRLPYKIRFNRLILEDFIAEGKIKSLDSNASHHSS